jgi:hypothetical protein
MEAEYSSEISSTIYQTTVSYKEDITPYIKTSSSCAHVQVSGDGGDTYFVGFVRKN